MGKPTGFLEKISISMFLCNLMFFGCKKETLNPINDCKNKTLPEANFKIYEQIKYPDPKQIRILFDSIVYIEEYIPTSKIKLNRTYVAIAEEKNGRHTWMNSNINITNNVNSYKSLPIKADASTSITGLNIQLTLNINPKSSCFENREYELTKEKNIPIEKSKIFMNTTFAGFFDDSIGITKKLVLKPNVAWGENEIAFYDNFITGCELAYYVRTQL